MRWLPAAVLAVAPLALAPNGAAAASCPEGFHLHTIGDGDHEHGEHGEHGEHVHVGLSMDQVDRNGNGLICVRHITPEGDIHVHIDDSAA